LVSPPFSGNVRHILKVSQNLHANTLLGIMAAHEGKTTLEEGIMIEASFLEEIGINPATISLIDGEGSSDNRVSPVAAVTLLQYMAGTGNYQVYRDALPILGVDGSLAKAAGPDNPAVGKIQAKTGTSIQGDLFSMFLTAKGLAGYMTTQSGREVAFAIYLNNVRVTTIEDIFVINSDMGDLAGVFWEAW
ncbi:MAG: D-alanyl-D-alanine carboxypeptidase, partial [Methanogenium sp.]|nr:D-alanyl-D-alanine carboxypeptidase [Methanogenium sp.]